VVRGKCRSFCLLRVLLCFLLVSCSGAGAGISDALENGKVVQHHEVRDIRKFHGGEYFCGPSALATLLTHVGAEPEYDVLVSQIITDTRKGAQPMDLLSSVRRQGYLPYVVKPDFLSLIETVSSDIPVLVLLNKSFSWLPRWHYVVVSGYNVTRRKVYYISDAVYESMSFNTFIRLWDRSGRWGLAVLSHQYIPEFTEPHIFFRELVSLEKHGSGEFLDSYYRTAIQTWPQLPFFRVGHANLFIRDEKYSIAEQILRDAKELFPDYVPVSNNLSFVLIKQGNYKEAQQYLDCSDFFESQYAEVIRSTCRMMGGERHE
jgi:hypothetical protein